MKEEFNTMRAQAKNWDESVLDRTDAKLLEANDATMIPVEEGLKDDQMD